MPVGEFTDPLTDIMKKSSVVLQEHPVNIARINAGKLPVSSLWLWGIGKPVPENQYQNSENCHTDSVFDSVKNRFADSCRHSDYCAFDCAADAISVAFGIFNLGEHLFTCGFIQDWEDGLNRTDIGS